MIIENQHLIAWIGTGQDFVGNGDNVYDNSGYGYYSANQGTYTLDVPYGGNNDNDNNGNNNDDDNNDDNYNANNDDDDDDNYANNNNNNNDDDDDIDNNDDYNNRNRQRRMGEDDDWDDDGSNWVIEHSTNWSCRKRKSRRWFLQTVPNFLEHWQEYEYAFYGEADFVKQNYIGCFSTTVSGVAAYAQIGCSSGKKMYRTLVVHYYKDSSCTKPFKSWAGGPAVPSTELSSFSGLQDLKVFDFGICYECDPKRTGENYDFCDSTLDAQPHECVKGSSCWSTIDMAMRDKDIYKKSDVSVLYVLTFTMIVATALYLSNKAIKKISEDDDNDSRFIESFEFDDDASFKTGLSKIEQKSVLDDIISIVNTVDPGTSSEEEGEGKVL